MVRIHTPARYLIKGDEKMVASNLPYEKSTLEGWMAKANKVIVKDIETRSTTVFFAGQVISFPEDETRGDLTKADLRALMPDREFPKNITKAKLMEAYYG